MGRLPGKPNHSCTPFTSLLPVLIHPHSPFATMQYFGKSTNKRTKYHSGEKGITFLLGEDRPEKKKKWNSLIFFFTSFSICCAAVKLSVCSRLPRITLHWKEVARFTWGSPWCVRRGWCRAINTFSVFPKLSLIDRQHVGYSVVQSNTENKLQGKKQWSKFIKVHYGKTIHYIHQFSVISFFTLPSLRHVELCPMDCWVCPETPTRCLVLTAWGPGQNLQTHADTNYFTFQLDFQWPVKARSGVG